MAHSGPLLVLEKVAKRFEPPDGGPAVEVLRGIDLEVDSGESIAVTGPSGCGKSTLLNLIGTLDQPTRGQVRLAGLDLSAASPQQLAAVRSRQIGFVFQAHHLLAQCSVLENVLIPTLALARQDASSDAPQRARRLLERVGLSHRLQHRPAQLSGGERQRVALVRALINQPKLLLADEPTGALDRASADGLAQLLVELNREEGVTLIVVTHSPDLAQRMRRQLRLRDGRFESAGAAPST